MADFPSLGTAARYAGVTKQSILKWTALYDIGQLIDGRWSIDKEKLDRVIAARNRVAEIQDSLRKSA
jgi:hypothetical protein